MSELCWTDIQWQKVNEAVAEAFSGASVASHPEFLRCYGPIAGGVETVRNERLLQQDATISLQVDHDSLNLRFVNLRVNVELSTEQVADETMVNALLAFRRAAAILAQEEDRIVFDGFQRGGDDRPAFVANKPGPQKGLADPLGRLNFEFVEEDGRSVVSAVVKAIRTLEDSSNARPFACILGNRLYQSVYDPNANSLVLPADRIIPIVKGPLLRSGHMNEFSGIVVSLASGAVDIVVGTPPTVQFLQRRPDGRFLFRVYERFVLRLRDEGGRLPVAGFTTRDIASAIEGVRGGEQAAQTAAEGLEKARQKASDAANRILKAARIQS